MSGWTYAGWRGNFYPKKLPQKSELAFASRLVNSIEINGTFYALQKPNSFQTWYAQVPEDYRFSVKGGQYITHIRRLKEVDEAVANFFASGILCLKEKLGPILWQFPPNVMLKDDRFEKFLKLLPYDSKSAGRLARRHGKKVEGRAWCDPGGSYPIRHAFEFRHQSFMNPDFIQMLRAFGVAVVFAHAGNKSPYVEDVTADFIYARLHGEDDRFHRKGYTEESLDWWTKRIKSWTSGKQPRDAQLVSTQKPKLIPRDAFIYFDNETKIHAPKDAMRLLSKLKIKIPTTKLAEVA